MNRENNLEELRKEYFQFLEKQLPLRARGVPYQKISTPTGLTLLVLVLFIIPFAVLVFGWGPYLLENPLVHAIILAVVVFGFVKIPPYFYHEEKRNRRWARKNHPHIYKTIYRFGERNKKDKMVVGVRLLRINEKIYFLGPYVRQRWWENIATLTGFVLLNEQGEVVEDEELFTKAFLTYNYGIIGAVTGQNIAMGEVHTLKESLNIYVPRSEKVLKMQRSYFEHNGDLHEWQSLVDYLPNLYEAARDALTIYDGREKFRKSMGYSFGYEYHYEDAVEELEMRQAFFKYMLAAHYKTINNTRVHAARLYENTKQHGGPLQKPIATNALKTVWQFAFKLEVVLDKMSQEGIPSDEDKQLYREKTAQAKAVLANKS
ncbi:MAG: hypothetical protein L6461_05175 [Anaerolineae bacterium]|nr:hypothetical protein [Anaerolineae bacterium]